MQFKVKYTIKYIFWFRFLTSNTETLSFWNTSLDSWLGRMAENWIRIKYFSKIFFYSKEDWFLETLSFFVKSTRTLWMSSIFSSMCIIYRKWRIKWRLTTTASPPPPSTSPAPTMFSRRESLSATVTGLAWPLLIKVPGFPTVQSSLLCKSLKSKHFIRF